jgi:hypothetical protein
MTTNTMQFSCRSCNGNLASNQPASQYQRQKLIQNTVRVPSSLYTMNLAGLTVFNAPLKVYQIVEQAGTKYYAPPTVNWNQMSDRPVPSVQKVVTTNGATYRASSVRNTVTKNRPGALSPGGIGVDIKHNSYDRYLNRLKGKSSLKRGVIPPDYGLPIPYNNSYPIQGGKTVKTAIISKCGCKEDDLKIVYNNESNNIQDSIYSVHYTYNVGDYVWVKKQVYAKVYYKAVIIDISDLMVTVKFMDDESEITTSLDQLQIYFDCGTCETPLSIDEQILLPIYSNSMDSSFSKQNVARCTLFSSISAESA